MESTNQSMTKKYILGAIIIAVSLIIMSASLSYAFFENEVILKSGNKGVDVSSGVLNVDFATTSTLNMNGVTLINGANKLSQAEKLTFTISLPSSGAVSKAEYSLYLTDIVMSDELKSSYLKWELHRGATMVSSGNFSGYTTGDITFPLDASNASIVKQTIQKADGAHTYTLYVWLENDANVNQNSLLNKSFSASIGYSVNTVAP